MGMRVHTIGCCVPITHKREHQLKPSVGEGFLSLFLSGTKKKIWPSTSFLQTKNKIRVIVIRDLKSWSEFNSPWLLLRHVPPGLILGAPDRKAQGKQNSPAAAETLHHLGQWEQRTQPKILSPLTEPPTVPSALVIPFLLFCSPPHLFILKK